MLAKAIVVHGVICYKFCWLLPSGDQNQGTPTGHENHISYFFVNLYEESKCKVSLKDSQVWGIPWGVVQE